jgi:hypothetical protein
LSFALLIRGDIRRCQAENPLIALFRFPEPALTRSDGLYARRDRLEKSSTDVASDECGLKRKYFCSRAFFDYCKSSGL